MIDVARVRLSLAIADEIIWLASAHTARLVRIAIAVEGMAECPTPTAAVAAAELMALTAINKRNKGMKILNRKP